MRFLVFNGIPIIELNNQNITIIYKIYHANIESATYLCFGPHAQVGGPMRAPDAAGEAAGIAVCCSLIGG